MPSPPRYNTFSDANAQAAAALALLHQHAQHAIAQRGRFVLALSGGTSPLQLYQLLGRYAENTGDLPQPTPDWSRWFIVYADERFVSADNPLRNHLGVTRHWLNTVHFPPQNHYPMPAKISPLDDVTLAATTYSQTIRALLPLDFALLGIGDDGHTASLFPSNMPQEIDNPNTVLAVHNAPKPPTERISLSYHALNSAQCICFLARAADKKQALQRMQEQHVLPATQIRGRESTVMYLDGSV